MFKILIICAICVIYATGVWYLIFSWPNVTAYFAMMWLFFGLFSCHEKSQSFRGGKDLFPTAKLTWCHFWHFFLLQSIRVSIFYGLELVFKVSFRVRNRFKIRINNVMSVWQLATTVAAILVLPIRHFGGFTFVAGWAIQFIYRSVVIWFCYLCTYITCTKIRNRPY